MTCKQSLCLRWRSRASWELQSTSVGLRALFSLSRDTCWVSPAVHSCILYPSVFSCLWLESAPLRRCPRSARWASSGSRTPRGSCGASSPCFRRWTAQSKVREQLGSAKPLAHSSPRDRRALTPQTQPPAAGAWSHRRGYGPDTPAGPPYCAGASKPAGEITAVLLTRAAKTILYFLQKLCLPEYFCKNYSKTVNTFTE